MRPKKIISAVGQTAKKARGINLHGDSKNSGTPLSDKLYYGPAVPTASCEQVNALGHETASSNRFKGGYPSKGFQLTRFLDFKRFQPVFTKHKLRNFIAMSFKGRPTLPFFGY